MKWRKKDNYERLKKLIIEFGEWDINISQLAKEWSIPRSSIQRWKEEIVEELGPINLSKVGRNIGITMQSNLRLCHRLIRKANLTKDKVSAIKAYNDTVNTVTDFLEKYGYKDKVAEKLDISMYELERIKLKEIMEENGNYMDKTRESNKDS